jgi:release factor glutamine methyltransferase
VTPRTETLLAEAVRELETDRNRGEAQREARILLGFVLGKSRAWLAAHGDDAVAEDAAARFTVLVQRRVRGEPIAYLVGRKEFRSLEFRVTPDVLIPRPETELLVEAALERLPDHAPCEILDLGTGSGCIAIALAAEHKLAKVAASDRSQAALNVARDNAQRIGVRVEFRESDWFEAWTGRRFDLILANPPYVAAGDRHLSQGDLRFEPQIALSAGADGLSDIRKIVADAPRHLHAGGWLIFEHGFDQAAACRKLMQDAEFSEVFALQDLAGVPRICGGRLLTAKTPNR